MRCANIADSVILSEAKDLLFARNSQILRFAQDDTDTSSPTAWSPEVTTPQIIRVSLNAGASCSPFIAIYTALDASVDAAGSPVDVFGAGCRGVRTAYAEGAERPAGRAGLSERS